MFKRISLWLLLFTSTALAKDNPKGVPIQNQTQKTLDELSEKCKLIYQEMAHLSSTIRYLQNDVNSLKLDSETTHKKQEIKIKNIAEEAISDNNKVIDHHINTLSSAFSKEINTLSEKLQNILNRIIALLNTQQKLSSAIVGTETKQPHGIAYEVKEGETLDSIGTQFKVTRESIKNLNFITDENRLSPGQMLFIPQMK